MLRNGSHDQNDEEVREIHALTPPPPNRTPPAAYQARHGETWENVNNRMTPFSLRSEGGLSDNFSTMSRDFSALVLAGSTTGNSGSTDMDSNNAGNALARIGEEDMLEETNPLAIVPDISSLDHGTSNSPRRNTFGAYLSTTNHGEEVMMHRVKQEEIESKIFAWQTAKISKINNRFKREDAIIVGWEGEQVQKSSSSMKKVERKLEEKRARALEKMQNEVAKAHRKAEERRASAEAKRGTKVARVLEIAKLMRAVGRAPSKRTFF